MKYYEIDAIKQGSRLVERFFEDGRRFIKHIPFNPKIVATLQEQFKNKPIKVELQGSWVVITKEGSDFQYAQAGKMVAGDKEVTMELIAEQEMIMLKKAGYQVSIVQGVI